MCAKESNITAKRLDETFIYCLPTEIKGAQTIACGPSMLSLGLLIDQEERLNQSSA